MVEKEAETGEGNAMRGRRIESGTRGIGVGVGAGRGIGGKIGTEIEIMIMIETETMDGTGKGIGTGTGTGIETGNAIGTDTVIEDIVKALV